MYGHFSGVLCEWSTVGKSSSLYAHSLEETVPRDMDYRSAAECWLPAVSSHIPLRMNGYDKLIQAAASRLIGYDSDLARYEVHKTVYMKQQLEDRYRSLEHMRLKNSLCANESSSSSMNKERIHSSETDIESYQLDNSCEEDRYSSSLNSPPSGPAAASSINNSRGHPDTPIPDGLPMVISRHGMGLLKTDMSNPDTSQLLREILQNKEKHQLSELAKNNNNSNNNNNNNNTNNNNNNNTNNNNNNNGNLSKLNGTNTLQDSSGLITNLLKNSSQQQLKSNSPDVDKLSCHSTEGSAEESDGESTIEQMTNDEETDVGDVKGVIMSSGMDSQLIDSKEAKRARVENIITSIRHSPTHSQCDSQSMQEQRRQKRKQHQPQQHELSPEFQESKIRKIERDDLGRQLMELKNQLNDVQRKYTALCNAESSERTGEGHDDDDCHTATSLQSVTSRGSKLNGESNLNNRENIAFDNSDIDPVQLINHASQMVKEQEIATKRSTPLASMPLPSADVQGLASSLKSEIIHTVDTIVSRFVKNQALKSLENSSNETKSQDQGPKERVKSPVNNPEFPTDFYAIPRVHDKQTLYDTSCPSAPDLPRAHNRPLSFVPSHHSTPQSIPSYFAQPQVLTSPVYSSEPEQTEALSLVVNTPKKKRTKVTDTRLSPRAARALLQENCVQVTSAMADLDKHIAGSYPHILPQMLPTSVAIPNPSLQHSDILGYYREQNYLDGARSDGHSPSNDLGSPGNTNSLSEPYMMLKSEGFDVSSETDGSMALTTTLTPMHLRKAKLMFFYVRYPSSAILKVFFPDIRFNKNNTAQLVKWFSNFREFYYIQMEKYAKQAISEGYKNSEDLVVTTDSELYRVLNLHYNRNNQIEVPENFRIVVQATLREFFKAISSGKDSEQSWKKAIYKIISRMDDTLPEFFKSPNWMEQLGDA